MIGAVTWPSTNVSRRARDVRESRKKMTVMVVRIEGYSFGPESNHATTMYLERITSPQEYQIEYGAILKMAHSRFPLVRIPDNATIERGQDDLNCVIVKHGDYDMRFDPEDVFDAAETSAFGFSFLQLRQ